MSKEKSSTVELECRCCGTKENFILPPIISNSIMGYITRFDIRYTCHDCAFIEDRLNQEG